MTGRNSSVRPLWTTAEFAWPLSLLSGFLGVCIGVELGLPGLGPLLAAFCFAPIYVRMLSDQRLWLAAVLLLGWGLALAAGASGAVLEWGFDKTSFAIPGSAAFTQHAFGDWIGGSPPAGLAPRLFVSLALMALFAASSKRSLGLLSLLGLGYWAALLGVGAGWFVEEALTPRMHAAQAALPPHHFLAWLGLAALTSALAVSSKLNTRAAMETSAADRPADERAQQLASAQADHQNLLGWRRKLLVAGVFLALVGLCLEPLLGPSWGRALASEMQAIRP